MHLSYLTDEVHPDFEAALRLGAAWGLHYAEVRTVDGVNVLELTDAQIERAKRLLADYGMAVSAIATPFFKCPLPGRGAAVRGPLHSARSVQYEDHVALLRRGVAIAEAFGTRYLRIFSFWREEGVDFWPALEAAVAATLAATAASEIIPCLENEGACFIGTSAELAEVARRLADPRLQFIWDPGNSTRHGLPPRAEDFAVFAQRIALVHMKDGVYEPATGKSYATVIDAGETDYRAELKRLHAAGYDGALTLEPHYCPGDDCVEGMRQSLAAVRALATELNLSFL